MCREQLACLLREIGSSTTRLSANIILPSPFRTCVRQHCQRWKQLRDRTGRHLVMLVVRCTWLPGVCSAIKRLCELYVYHSSHWLNSLQVLHYINHYYSVMNMWLFNNKNDIPAIMYFYVINILVFSWPCVAYVDVMLQECRGRMKAQNRRKAYPNSFACIGPPENLLCPNDR
jgi:hypothetical protein